MSAFADLVRFLPVAGGTTDWVVSSVVGGCQLPSAANVVNVSYKVYAVSTDLTQWEVSTGIYNSGTTTFPRTVVLYNSSGTGTATGQSGAGTKINFSTIPQVSVVAIAEDLIQVEIANSFTTTQKKQAQANIFVGPTIQTFTSGTSATYTTPAGCLWIEVFAVGGGGGGNGTGTVANTFVAGSNGSTTTFNSINANGGSGAPNTGSTNGIPLGGAGGTGGTGAATNRMPGSGGGTGNSTALAFASGSGFGGGTVLGGGSTLGTGGGTANGITGAANTGAGGSGAANGGGTNNNEGAGGGGGESFYLIINNPSATYTYTVGLAGVGGSSTNTGRNRSRRIYSSY